MKLGSVALSCLMEAFSYSPSQPRIPKGQKGAGRWSPSGVSTNSGHDLWVMNGFSYAATAAAAKITGAKGWDDEYGNDSYAESIAESMLHSIQGSKVRSTPGYSGHTGAPDHQVGDIFEIPLMAITPVKPLAEAYADIDTSYKGRSPADHQAEVDRQTENVLSTISRDSPEYNAKTEVAIRNAFSDIHAKSTGLTGMRQVERFRPATMYKFVSNKSTPIRSNERVVSGRYRVTAVENTPLPITLYNPKTFSFSNGYSRTVTLEFVEDLPIQV